MFKRLFWFGSGAATGAAGSFWVRKRVQRQMQRFTPAGIREQAVHKAKQAAADAQSALNEGRSLARNYRERTSNP